MSDWEVVPSSHKQDIKQPQNNSDWEIAPLEPNSRQPQAESLGTAALKAPGRIGEDLYRGGMNFIRDLPGYYEKAKTEVPGLINLIEEHPIHAAGQGLAGFGEMLQGLAGLPHGIASYGANRLNLIPKSFAEQVPYPKDRTQQINNLLGEPKYPGEALIRGTARNAAGILGGGKLANALNPANLSVRSIAKDIVNTEQKQISSHSKIYNKIWDEAKKSGFNEIPINRNVLTKFEKLLKNHKTPKEFESLTDLIKNPTLENAQQAQSQMNRISRTLYEKSKKGALDKWENKLYDAALKAEKHIEENMFKNKNGQINKKLQDQYKKVTKSYRENVVPYKYNQNIQKYKDKKMLASELVNALSKGEFAAQKGNKHRALQIRNMIKEHPFLSGLGVGGLGLNYYNSLMGNKLPSEENNR